MLSHLRCLKSQDKTGNALQVLTGLHLKWKAINLSCYCLSAPAGLKQTARGIPMIAPIIGVQTILRSIMFDRRMSPGH